jgi:hypothetical protein
MKNVNEELDFSSMTDAEIDAQYEAICNVLQKGTDVNVRDLIDDLCGVTEG